MKMEKFWQSFFLVFSKIGSYPYSIQTTSDSKDVTLKIEKKSRYIIWHFALSLLVSHLLYTATTLIINSKNYIKNNDFVRIIFHVFWLFSYLIIVAGNQFNLILYRNDTQKLCNGTLELCQHFQRNIHSNLFHSSQKIRSLLLTFMCSNVFPNVGLCCLPTFILFRSEPFHIGSHAYNLLKNISSGNREILATVCGSLLEGWIITMAWGAGLMHMYIQLVIIQTFTASLSFYLR